jgi:hypothetical protein
MPYFVTHGGTDGRGRPGPVGIDPGLTLEQALHMACSLLAQRQPSVTINDGKGNTISGNELVACCNGEKTLSADLRAN